jgi:hypothetical protein
MAKQVFVLDAELKEHVQNVVRQMLNSFQPRPKRGRRRRIGGEGESTPEPPASTAVTVAKVDIPESAEIAFSQVPGPIQQGIENYEEIPQDAKCWKLSTGNAAIYQLVSTRINGDMQDVYMVPAAPANDRTAYNTAGLVKKDKPLQGKLMNVRLGGGELVPIFVIDVEKCDDA